MVRGTFCPVFAFSFTSCYNSNVLPQLGVLQHNSLNFDRADRNFKVVIASRETIRLYDGYDFQDSKVLTSIL